MFIERKEQDSTVRVVGDKGDLELKNVLRLDDTNYEQLVECQATSEALHCSTILYFLFHVLLHPQ